MSLKLNVGCGTDPYGDVRIDIAIKRQYCEEKNTLNLFADAHKLPLRRKVFSESRCFHVLEHLKDPNKAVNEINRVTNGIVTLRFPVWHGYSFLIEVIFLIKVLLHSPIEYKKHVMNRVLSWKNRYSEHKYYLKPIKAKINKQYMLPREYEIKYNIEHMKIWRGEDG